MERTGGVFTEQVIRPTGLIDPPVEVRPVTGETRNQVDDVIAEVKDVAKRGYRSLVTVLTKKMAEDLTEYMHEQGVRVRYMHSDVDTLERIEIIRDLRLGAFDVLVGINLLREGLDIPECALVAILDADKEGFLRSETSLIQTIGRAARNLDGRVILYGDHVTGSMERAMAETDRRREKQVAYNLERGIDPQPLRKRIADITEVLAREEADTAALLAGRNGTKKAPVPNLRREGIAAAGGNELEDLIRDLNEQMLEAAGELKFELAARLRDEVADLKRELRQMERAGHLT
jgi:excinuclease ABC subunit B